MEKVREEPHCQEPDIWFITFANSNSSLNCTATHSKSRRSSNLASPSPLSCQAPSRTRCSFGTFRRKRLPNSWIPEVPLLLLLPLHMLLLFLHQRAGAAQEERAAESRASYATAANASGARRGTPSTEEHRAVPQAPTRCLAAPPEEVSSVPVGRRPSRTPPPLPAPPALLNENVERCGGGPSPAPWPPSS